MQISWSRASEWNRWKSTIVFKCMNSVECNNWYFMVQHMISFKDSTWSIISALCHDDQPTGGSYAAAVTKLFVFVWCVLYRKTHSVMQIEGGGEWQTHAPRNALLSKGIPLLFVSLLIVPRMSGGKLDQKSRQRISLVFHLRREKFKWRSKTEFRKEFTALLNFAILIWNKAKLRRDWFLTFFIVI